MMSKSRAVMLLAICALVATLLVGSAVAQEDAAPSSAHLIVHKVRVDDKVLDANRMSKQTETTLKYISDRDRTPRSDQSLIHPFLSIIPSSPSSSPSS
jgi:hypothetical protein